MTSLREAFGADYACTDPECEPGQFCTSRATCQSCPTGYACNDGVKTICPPGTYGDAGTSRCISCIEGYYQPSSGASECIRCPVGKYSEIQGASFCLDCATGSYSDSAGASKCTDCPDGKIYDYEQSKCICHCEGEPCVGDEYGCCAIRPRDVSWQDPDYCEDDHNGAFVGPCPDAEYACLRSCYNGGEGVEPGERCCDYDWDFWTKGNAPFGSNCG